MFDIHRDIGAPDRTGSTKYDASAQEYWLSGGGRNMWGARDEFHFAARKIEGDFILQATVQWLGEGAAAHRKAGWMIRGNFDTNAPYVDGVVHGDGLTSLQYRRSQGGLTQESKLSVRGADVIQLERKGNRYIFSAARFGEPFSAPQMIEVALGDEVYVGLLLCAHHAEAIERAVFRNVRIIRPAPEGFVPYQDYLGSHLEVLEVASGRRQVVHSSAQPLEAPGWTADGTALIYNSSGVTDVRGHLYRLDLERRQPILIDAGSAKRITNHALSFDGATLAVSDYSTGQSAVFTLPVRGGSPTRVTSATPSYLHGWSPDGKFLVYTGRRGGEFDIYKMAADGSGSEVRLTHSPGLDDGAEYTPDGKYIYFNSVRSGRMQIWRMKPDGSEPRQVTSDEYNNWWPHPSPDGRWLALLSYGPDVAPDDHPYYRHVYLRLMSIAGGPPKVVAYVYGGQGTINVPSWSPDARQLAFISNSGPLLP